MVGRASANDTDASDTAYTFSRSYAANGFNEYMEPGPATFVYAANGNLISDGSSSFVYDAENRSVSASGANNATLSYDPFGPLWEVSSPAGATSFLYEGDRLIEERNGSGQWLRLYAHWPGVDEPLVWYEMTGGPVRRYLHADHQGSVVASNDHSENVAGLAGYDSLGISNSTSLTNVGRLGYTARRGAPSSACGTTRPASTRPRSAGSSRRTQSGKSIRSTIMPISETILSLAGIRTGSANATVLWIVSSRAASRSVARLRRRQPHAGCTQASSDSRSPKC